MTPEQFCYWLQGFVENQKEPITFEQWENVRNHLKTVFYKVTPDIGFSNDPTKIPNNYLFPKVIC